MTTTWEQVRSAVGIIAEDKGEWAGLPVPVEGVKLVLESRHPFPNLNGCVLSGDQPGDEAADGSAIEAINDWHSYHRNCHVFIFREDGKIKSFVSPENSGSRLRFWWNTFSVAAQHAWTIATETRALEKLKELVSEQAFKCYTLAGAFLETSKRSGVSYMFRKLRPTLALRPDRNQQMRLIAALCLHPIGFYDRSWAGVMTPTDDVIAHLVLMRGDEHRFWGKANHHPSWAASAGL